jgi:6-phosphogluconate dehydrogenase (decarboxylating)
VSKAACSLGPYRENLIHVELRESEALPECSRHGALRAFTSRGEADFQNKLLSAMRFQFGDHLEKSAAK